MEVLKYVEQMRPKRFKLGTIEVGYNCGSGEPDAVMIGYFIGLCSSFINEHKMFRVQTGLARTPFIAGLGDVGAILLGGAQ
jgi:hypothetical protein